MEVRRELLEELARLVGEILRESDVLAWDPTRRWDSSIFKSDTTGSFEPTM